MSYCVVNNTKIYYEEEGQGETMLLVHGASQDTSSWRYAVPYLSKEFKTVAIDLPGHGKSLRCNGELTKSVEEYAAFLNEFIDVLNLGKVLFMGHSMAGGISLQVGLNRPDQLKAAIALNGAGTTSMETVSYNDDILDLVTVNPSDFNETNFISLCGRETSAERKRIIGMEGKRNPADVIVNDLRAFISFDIRPRLKDVAFPVIFITGEDDYAVTVETVRRTKSMLRSSTALEVLKGVGHFPHMEAPEKVAEAFLRLLPSVL